MENGDEKRQKYELCILNSWNLSSNSSPKVEINLTYFSGSATLCLDSIGK